MTIRGKAAIWDNIAVSPETQMENTGRVTTANLSESFLPPQAPRLYPVKHRKPILNFNHMNSSLKSLELLTTSQLKSLTGLGHTEP